MSKKIECCICGRRIKDRESNNPRPIKYKGRCCHKCDESVVLKERRRRSALGLKPNGDQPYLWSERRMQQYLQQILQEKPTKPFVILNGYEFPRSRG
jgi:hypothetical protein